ncbi:cuticular glutathione peroxidase-like [Haliotis cracherodii]|uniref:cuticular glutathione peroxidase-like n=1 Tax=Haliotis cracherodii TaxID=6455 RepID=UPI0039E75920
MKIHVNGEEELPLYRYLKDSCPVPLDASYDRTESFWDPIKVNDISWNFEKFLIDQNGRPLFRFRPDVEPMDLEKLVELMLETSMDRDQWKAKAEDELQIIHNKMEVREEAKKREEEKKKQN